jgi:hypothetical protein
MNDPKCKRFHRVCDEFSLCINIGEKEYVLAEHPNERYTIFYYGVYGKGKLGRIFESDYITVHSKYKTITDVQEYVNSKVIFEAEEDFFLIGFNTLDKNQKWKYSQITENQSSFVVKELDSYILCFDGKPFINGKKFKRYDYAKLDFGEEYQVDLNDNGVLVIFSKVQK